MKVRKNKLLKVTVLFLFIIILYFVFFRNRETLYKVSTQSNTKVSSKENKVNLKIVYFDDFGGVWGSASPSEETQWKAIDSKYDQSSASTAIINSLNLIKKESIKINPVKRSELKFGSYYIEENYKEEEPLYYKIGVNANYQDYGELLGGFFANRGEGIMSHVKADVDNDGIKEEVIETAGFGGNHPPHHGYIVKNGVIILYVPLDNGGIEPAKDNNGFYVYNPIRDDGSFMCCPKGYWLYRIIYENGSFKPVWEQDVQYILFDTKK